MTAAAQTILIVEDDPATSELERRALSRAGLNVRVVASVADAIAKLRSESFGAVVLDYQLPDGDPWSVVAAAQAITPRVPVVIVTAMGNELIAAEALAHGVAEYLPKSDAFWNQLPHVVERVAKIAEVDARLRRSDVLFRLIADRSTDLIATVDLNGVIRDVSNAVTNMLGYEPSELIGKQSLDYMHPEDRARITELFTAHKDQTRSTYRQLRRDGSYAWVEVSSSMVYDETSGAPQEVVGVIRDVTERKLAEDKLQTLLEGSPEALVIVDQPGMIVLVNARTEQLFGYSRDEMLNRPADLLLVHGLRSDTPWAEATPASQANDQIGATRELICRRKDGSEFPAELSLNRLETHGEWLIACAFVDTTQRKTIQDQELLLRLGHELPRFEEVDSLVAHVVTTIGQYLAVDACIFTEIDATRGTSVAHRDYSRFGQSVTGSYPISAYTPKVRAELELGKVVSIIDTKTDPRTSELYEERYVGRKIRSMAAVPLMRDSSWLGAIFVHVGHPRAWAAREIQMLQALAERTWLWMENVRMLRALRDSEGKYRRFIETTHEGVWEIDDQAKTTFVNPRMAEMLGYSIAEMLGKGLDFFMDDEGRGQLARNVDRRKAGIAESHDFKFVRKDGAALWARLEVSPLTNDHGKYLGS
ncbi:MAG TPA: PAS domain S-box protein, partial [Polyangiales bacterium]